MICSRVERRVASAWTGSVHGVGKTSNNIRLDDNHQNFTTTRAQRVTPTPTLCLDT
jgi:hypothetical protein